MGKDERWNVTPDNLGMSPRQAAGIEELTFLFRTLDPEGARYGDEHYASGAHSWFAYCVAALARRA